MSPTSKFKVLGVPTTGERICLNTLVCARVNVYNVHIIMDTRTRIIIFL